MAHRRDRAHRIHAGDRIEVEIPPATPASPQPEAIPLDIVHDDPDLVVVNKPAGRWWCTRAPGMARERW